MSTNLKYELEKSTLFCGLISGIIFIGFFDPINWPKQIALLTLAPVIFYTSINNRLEIDYKAELKSKKVNGITVPMFSLTIFLIIASAISSTIIRDVPLTRTLWGSWGRSNGILTTVALWIVALSFYWLARRKEFAFKFSHSLEVSSIAFCAYGALQWFGLDPVNWSKSNEVFSFFGNTNFASAVFSLCASVFIVLLFFGARQSIGWRVFRFFTFCLATFLTFATNSIQGLSALLLVLILVIYIKFDFKKTSVSWLYMIISCTSGFVVFLGTLGIGPLGNSIGQYTVQLRYEYWLAGLKMGVSSPIFGVGVDSYGDYFRTYRSQEVAEATSIDLITNNAHNIFIQSFATMGILGLLGILIPFIGAVFLSVKMLIKKDVAKIDKGFVAIFLSLWAMALFSIDNISIAVWNYVFLGVVWGLGESLKSSSDTNISKVSKKNVSQIDSSKYLVFAVSALMFTLSWFASLPERNIFKYLSNPINNQDVGQVKIRVDEIRKLSNHPFVLETGYWYLAAELNKLNNSVELYEVLEIGLTKYRKDFNLLDLSAGYREQQGLQSEALKFRERQLEIEDRHPRIWLSYAYDLLALGREKDAQQAFLKVIENQVFLDESFKEELKTRATDFGL